MRVVCHPLSVDDLEQILKTSEGSIVRQYRQSFAAYGIRANFEDAGLRRIAELAIEEETGARGLMTVCEKVFRDLKFELPSSRVKEFPVDGGLVDDPRGTMETLLANAPEQDEEEVDEHHDEVRAVRHDGERAERRRVHEGPIHQEHEERRDEHHRLQGVRHRDEPRRGLADAVGQRIGRVRAAAATAATAARGKVVSTTFGRG